MERSRIVHLEDLQHFKDTRANRLLLTPPRNMQVDDPEKDLLRLFWDLVEEPTRAPLA